MKRHVSRLFAILLSLLTVCSVLTPVAFCEDFNDYSRDRDSSESDIASRNSNGTLTPGEATSQPDEYYHEISKIAVSEPTTGYENPKIKTITARVTDNLRAKDGTLLWSVTLYATFSYDEKSNYSKCTSAYNSINVYGSSWSREGTSVTKNGCTATSSVNFSYNNAGASMSSSHTNSYLTLTCSPSGKVS